MKIDAFSRRTLTPFSGTLELDLPKDWRRLRMPPALHERLQELLDRQDLKGKLSAKERREATALTELVDLLALIRVRAELAAKQDHE